MNSRGLSIFRMVSIAALGCIVLVECFNARFMTPATQARAALRYGLLIAFGIACLVQAAVLLRQIRAAGSD